MPAGRAGRFRHLPGDYVACRLAVTFGLEKLESPLAVPADLILAFLLWFALLIQRPFFRHFRHAFVER